MERTIFLLTFISDVKLREVIHRSTNKVEEYHNFEDWITFALRGVIVDNVFEEQEKQIKYTGVSANCLMLDNMWNRKSLSSLLGLRHLLCKNLISRILKNFHLLWKRIAKERRFLISSSCTQDDGEPKHLTDSLWISVTSISF